MKKLIVVIALLFSCICITGCSSYNHQTTWNMEYIQGKNGDIIYCSNENNDIYPNAEVKNIMCRLQESSITITDKDTANEWTGTCKIISTDSKSTMYEVKFENNKTGYLVKSFTKYADNTQHDTLIISCDEYSLNLTIQ